MKIETGGIQNFYDNSQTGQTKPARKISDIDADASLGINYTQIIETALNTQAQDPDAVQKAKNLLLSGSLDSPEYTRAAAENIIKFGF
jgi:hypothetical protein